MEWWSGGVDHELSLLGLLSARWKRVQKLQIWEHQVRHYRRIPAPAHLRVITESEA
jgi:hypothetical protein